MNARLSPLQARALPPLRSRPFVQLNSVSLSFGGPRIACWIGVSIEVSDGEFAAVVGPSGCGKSLMKLVTGLLPLILARFRLTETLSPAIKCVGMAPKFNTCHGEIRCTMSCFPKSSAVQARAATAVRRAQGAGRAPASGGRPWRLVSKYLAAFGRNAAARGWPRAGPSRSC